MADEPNTDAVARLAGLLLLAGKARQALDATEIGFLLVNDTRQLVPYRSAVWWRDGVRAVSALAQPAADSPFTHWVSALCRTLPGSGEPVRLGAADVSESLAGDWAATLPTHALWLPMAWGQGGLLLARDVAWGDAELRILAHWIEAAAHALHGLGARPPFDWRGLRHHPRARWVAGALAVLLLFPIRLDVLAPTEVVPKDPAVIRAPLAGVVDEVAVTPNAAVKAGDVLVRLDSRELSARLDVVRQGYEVALAELRLAQQGAIGNVDAAGKAALLAAQVEERRAEVAQVEKQLERVVIGAESDGMALIADPAALKGKPVRLGERLLTVADPGKAEIELWIPVADAVAVEPGAAVTLFLNVAPERALSARLRFANLQSSPSPEGPLAFRAVADFTGERPPPRVGLRGIASVDGPRAPLLYYLLRRPLAALRQMVGI
ncbi:MAG: HlyD family efflux transporter periplasmic adaptor subunit [Magnetospirillum sp.]|nr:HlyD family efflux transporter periplasmic adaptor subunit [Magnetospirillum sp.]